MKELLKRFHLNGNTLGFHQQTRKLELHTKLIVPCEGTVEEVSFEWSHRRVSYIGLIVRTTHKTSSAKPRESAAEEVSLNNRNNHTVGFHPHNRELLLHVLII